MSFDVKILADSVSSYGHRLTTFSVVYPRIIHAEFLRHRVLSRCAVSSRAIPFLEQVRDNPYIPEKWGRNQKGMQAGEDIDGAFPGALWREARDNAYTIAKRLSHFGVHKQWVNRLLEPFQWMAEVITATEWDNLFHLRISPDAHPDIQKIVGMMREVREDSKPRALDKTDWHLPLLSDEDLYAFSDSDPAALPWKERLLASVGRVARVTLLRHEDESDVAKDIERANNMLKNGHMSPFEHVARPMTSVEYEDAFGAWWATFDKGPEMPMHEPSFGYNSGNPTPLANHISKKGLLRLRWRAFCGNLNGWVSMRKEIPYEDDIKGDHG